jgi:PAS domain S-box-containing protein
MRPLKAYALAALSVSMALVLTLITPPAREKLPYLLLTLAVAVSASLGSGPGVFATLLGAAMADYFITPPLNTFTLSHPEDYVRWVLFCLVGFGITWITHRLKRSRENILTANQTLAEAQRRTDMILESISDGFLVIDRDWRYSYINAEGARMMGRTPEGLLGKSAWESWPEDSPFGAAFRRAMSENVPVQVEAFYPEPLNRWYQIRCYPSPNGLSLFCSDVSEGKQAEEEVRRQREWLRVTLSSIGDSVLATDCDGKITFLNPVAAELTGWTEEQALGQPAREVFRIIDEETRAKAEDIVSRVLRDKCVVALANHTAIVARNGREIPVEDSAAPILDSAGNLLGTVLVFHDVTEKRRTQESLHESEAQFRTLANAIPQLCWMANADGWIFWYNQRWYEYTGTTPEQMEGWGWQSVHDPAMLANVMERWKASIATGQPFDMIFPLRGADGVFRPFLTRIMPVHDREGKVARWFGTNTDVTEHREREEALLHASEQRRLALEAADLGAWDYRFDSGEVYWDERCRNMFGVPSGREIDYNEAIAHIHAEDRTATDEAVKQAIAGVKGGAYHREFRVVWPDGSVHWVASHGRVHFEGEGDERRAVRFVGVNMDITERKKAEDRLRQAQKLESVGLLAGGIAHDFNNLLVGVIGNASLAETMLPQGHEAIGLMDRIVKTGEQAAQLTRQMLAYSGKGRFFIERSNLSDLISEICPLIQPSIAKKIELRLELDRGLPPIEADRGQIQQVIMNLILNAAEAIGSDAGVVTVTAGLREVVDRDAAELPTGTYVCLGVCDTGCGMDEATKARIFDPFYSTKFIGRGLGLAAVGGIVRGHKGAITVTSSPGKGSCFTVLFPAAEGTVADSPLPARETNLVGRGTVLVVDDEEVVRDVAKHTLERYGYQVLLANSGLAAIDVFKRHPGEITLVVLDLSMPGMGGDEALPELRRIRPNVKVVVSSGYSEAEMMRLFAGQRVSGLIQKPFTSNRLAEKVKIALG